MDTSLEELRIALIEEYRSYLREKLSSLSHELSSYNEASAKLKMAPLGLSDRLQQGLHRSIFMGTGLEFLEVREYNYGDDPRMIDWNVTARMGRLFVRTFIEEKEIPLFFLIDMHMGMLLGSKESKLEKVFQVMKLISALAMRNSEKFGMWLAVEGSSVPIYIPPLKGPRQVYRMFSSIVRALPLIGRSTFPNALRAFLRMIRRRSFAFIISDFSAFNLEELRAILRALSARHEVIAVLVTDEMDLRLPDLGLVQLFDLSTGELLYIDTSDSQVRRAFEDGALRRQRELISSLESLGVDLMHVKESSDILKELLKVMECRRYARR